MGRPAKPTAMNRKHLTKKEKEERQKAEDALKGNVKKLNPPKWMNNRQKAVFRSISRELKKAELVGDLDIYVLTQFAVAVERLEEIEKLINDTPEMMVNKELMAAKARYAADLSVGYKELALTPQARAKVGSLAAAKEQEKKDPLLQILQEAAGEESAAAGEGESDDAV